MYKSILIGGAALMALSHAAFAQSPDASEDAAQSDQIQVMPLRLTQIEVAGLRPQTVTGQTKSITLIETPQLAVRDAPLIADQLRAVPGTSVSRSGSAGGLTQVRIRGAEANHTLVLLDGIEISDPTTGETDFGLISGLSAARIEVARGEQSALYGSDAIGGVINIVSAQPLGVEARGEYGNRETYRLDGSFGVAAGGGGVSFIASATGSEGVDTSGRGGERDGHDAWSGMVTGERPVGGWQAKGLLRYGRSEVETDPDLDFDGRLDNADRETQSDHWTVGGGLSGDSFGLNHQLRASFNRVERENFADDADDGATRGERTTFSYSPSFLQRHRLGETRYTARIDHEREDYTRTGPASFFGDPNQSARFDTLGVSGEAELRAGRWSASLAARHDNNDGRFEDASTWRVGAAFDTGPGTLRASLGTGVKNPTFVELFGFFPESFIGNPDLEPEQSTSWEVGWEQTLNAFGGVLNGSLTYFDAQLENEIFTRFNADFTSTAANRTGESDRSGIEANANWRLNQTWRVYGALSHITSSDDSGGDEIRVPEWTGSLALSWQPDGADSPRGGIAADYVGEQGDTDFGTFSPVTLDAYWLVSASLDWPVSERLALTLRGDNLLDETVTDVFGYEGPGAAILVGFRLR